MIVSPTLLVSAAEKAGMKIPPDVKNFEDFQVTHPHFFVFCMVQLCRPLHHWGVHWDNAEVIAKVSDEDITKLSMKDLVERGLCV